MAQSHRIEHDQQCVLAPVDPQPFASPQPISLSVVADGSPTVAARSFVSADGRGYVTAGYVRDDDGAGSAGRFVGAAPGVGAFAGLTIHFAGRSEPDGTIVLHWYVGDGPAPPDATGDEPTAEVEFRCEEVPAAAAPGDTGTTDADATAPSGPVTVEQSCTYTGDEPHAIPEDGTSRAVLTATGGGAGRFGETRFVAATYDSGTVRTLLVDPDGTVRFAGLAAGTEAGADTLVDELGWGRLDAGGATTGVIRLTTVPEDT
jgi:hypothetical protein